MHSNGADATVVVEVPRSAKLCPDTRDRLRRAEKSGDVAFMIREATRADAEAVRSAGGPIKRPAPCTPGRRSLKASLESIRQKAERRAL